MKAIHAPVTRASRLVFMLLIASAGPVIGDEPLVAPRVRDALNKISLIDALQLSPSFLSSVLEVGSDGTGDSEWKFALLDGFNKLRKGEHKAAVESLTVAIEAKPTDPASYWLRARALADLSQFALAKEDCHEALKISPEFTPAHLTLAAITLESDGAAAALRIIEQNCSPKGDHGDVSYEHYVTAVAHLKDDKPELAVEHLEVALRGSSTHLPLPTGALWLLKAVALERVGELANALLSARRSVEADEDNASTLFFVWSLQRKLGNHLAAFETAKRLSESDKEDVKYKIAMLRSLIDLRQYWAAEAEATEILSIEPENAVARQVLDRIENARTSSQARSK